MRVSMVMGLPAFFLALSATAALADETAAPAPTRAKVYTTEGIVITLRPPRPHAVAEINRLVPRAPLPELRQPLLDRISAVVEKDPF
jgi:hypothetical protein